MPQRLEIIPVTATLPIIDLVYALLSELTGKTKDASPRTQEPLKNSCALLASGGAVTLVAQRRVQDPDFQAEYGAYYSRQFAPVSKFCTRVHFFKISPVENEGVLSYLDRAPTDSYLGFVTLRPVIKSPVGASIIDCAVTPGFMRSTDRFPVHIAGREYSVNGIPFMQQDNAVGACAQASIWMALRTLRKRHGDRAYDPAQITDAATKYLVTGRTRPNRQGLTEQQMTEAIRAAGYSPHLLPLGNFWYRAPNASTMNAAQVSTAMIEIHPYIESDIPVVLILYPPSGGHAVVVIGHRWQPVPVDFKEIKAIAPNNVSLAFKHAVSWAPSFIVHNDNTGPYRDLTETQGDYSLQYAASAIPLLPADVFMSAEEAMALALEVVASIFGHFKDSGFRTEVEVQALAENLVVRLLLVEKRKLRRWAATTTMPPELKERIRLMDFPKRIWVLELHHATHYGTHGTSGANTLVGLVLIDSTGDELVSSALLLHLNLAEIVNLPHGVLVEWDTTAGIPKAAVQTVEAGPVAPLRA